MNIHKKLHRKWFHLSLACLVVAASASLLFYWSQRTSLAARQAQAQRGSDDGQMAALNGALTPDGRLKPGIQGSFNTAGYRMVLGSGGAPRFVPTASTCARWDDQFRLPNGTNGQVNALAVSGTTLYVGGQFSIVGDLFVSNVAKYDTVNNTWTALNTPMGEGVNGVVNALVVSGSDVFVGGTFTTANVGAPATQVSASRVARWNSATMTWSALTGPGGGNGVGTGSQVVRALAVSGSNVYVGGFFTAANVGGSAGAVVSATNVARWDSSNNTWSALNSLPLGEGVGGPPSSSFPGVHALAVNGDDVFVGGDFGIANLSGAPPVFVNNVAKWNRLSTTWSALNGPSGGNGVQAPPGPVPVRALAVSGSDVYVGGNFFAANALGGPATVNANNVAKWNSGVWSALTGANSGDGVDHEVRALALNAGDVYVGGLFALANVGGGVAMVNANSVAKWNSGSGWSALTGPGGGNGVPGTVLALAFGGGAVFAGGDSARANLGGTEVTAYSIAKFSSNVWSALGEIAGANGVVSPFGGGVLALLVSGNSVYVGGFFSGVGNVPANSVAKWDDMANTWSALKGPGGGNGIDGEVRALALSGNDLYVGGQFFTANFGGTGGTFVQANSVARWNSATNTWSALNGPDPVPIPGNGVGSGGSPGVVNALAVSGNGSDVYVGGQFNTANLGGSPVNANNVAKWNSGTNTWSALNPTVPTNGVNGTVNALALSGNDLYVGGQFLLAAGTVPVNNVAKWNSGVWSPLSGGGTGNGVNTTVFALALSGNFVYVGGQFTRANFGAVDEVLANRVARWNSTTPTWSALPGAGGGNGVGTNSSHDVRALAVSGNDVYVGGQFMQANTGGVSSAAVTAFRVAKWTSTTNTWSSLNDIGGTPGMIEPGVTVTVRALAAGASLFAGGTFNIAGNAISLRFARFCPNNPPNIGAVAVTRQQGTPTANSQIGNAIDAEDLTNTLTVTVSSDGTTFGATATKSGVTVSNITVDGVGIVRANVVADCTAATTSFTLKVTDSDGATATATLNVTVNANTPPTLTYNNPAAIVFGSGTTVNPATGPSDNGNVASIVVQSTGTFTGTVNVNNTTGVVTISNAAPIGTHTITIRATDNCGGASGTTNATFSLTVNKANTLTAITSDNPDPSVVAQVVTATYNATPVAPGAGTLTGNVTVNANTGESCTGTVAAGGCTLTFNTAGARTLSATYTGDANFNGSTSAAMPHDVLPALQNALSKLVHTDPLLCAGELINGSFGQTNNTAAPLSGRVFATLQNLLIFPTTVACNLTPAAGGATTFCAVENGAPTWRGTLAAGQSVTITYQAQVPDTIAANAQVCSTAQTQFPDVTGTIVATTPFCLTLNCPVFGPGTPFPAASQVSDQKAGSVLIYNLYTSSTAAPGAQDTRISVANTHPSRPIAVHLFFVDGATCSVADAYICLTPNQKATFLASDLDPGTTGYMVAVATDVVSGCPINFNYLIGSAHVKLSSGHTGSLNAEAFAALTGVPPVCDGNSVTALLSFDGLTYNQAPRVLALDDVPARADGNDTLIVLNRLGGSLAATAATLGPIFGILYDDTENPLSFTFPASVCQFRSSLSNNFPRTAPRFEQFIPAGRSGWAKFYSLSDIGLLGAAFNFNSNAKASAGAFNQGRNLHKLTLTSAATLTIPIFPPNC